MKTKTLLLSLLVPISALAETPIRVVLVEGRGALTGPELSTALGIAQAKLASAGRASRVTKIRRLPDACLSQNTISNFPNQFGCYEAMANRLRRFKHGPTLVLTPPMSSPDGQRFIGGVARGGCLRHVSRRVAWVAATGQSITGEPRTYLSAIAIAHELAHIFGASSKHPTDGSIMDSNALAIAKTQNLNFSAETASQMSRCRNRGGFF